MPVKAAHRVDEVRALKAGSIHQPRGEGGIRVSPWT